MGHRDLPIRIARLRPPLHHRLQLVRDRNPAVHLDRAILLAQHLIAIAHRLRNRWASVNDEEARLHATSVGQPLLGNGKIKVGDELQFVGAIVDDGVDQRLHAFRMLNATVGAAQRRNVGDLDAIDHDARARVVEDTLGR